MTTASTAPVLLFTPTTKVRFVTLFIVPTLSASRVAGNFKIGAPTSVKVMAEICALLFRASKWAATLAAVSATAMDAGGVTLLKATALSTTLAAVSTTLIWAASSASAVSFARTLAAVSVAGSEEGDIPCACKDWKLDKIFAVVSETDVCMKDLAELVVL